MIITVIQSIVIEDGEVDTSLHRTIADAQASVRADYEYRLRRDYEPDEIADWDAFTAALADDMPAIDVTIETLTIDTDEYEEVSE